jgi:hypothetical protein
MVKNKGNKGSRVEDMNAVCQQRKETQKKNNERDCKASK